jgi:hypothetical protein
LKLKALFGIFSDKPKPNHPGEQRDPGAGGASDDSTEDTWDRHRKQNKDKPEASGSKHEGSTSYKQNQMLDHYDSCFSPVDQADILVGGNIALGPDGDAADSNPKFEQPASDDDDDDMQKSGQDLSGDISDDSSKGDAYSDDDDDDYPPRPKASSVGPMQKMGTQSVYSGSDGRDMMSWNSANAKATAMSADIMEEINDDQTLKCTPEEDVFDKDFGSRELEDIAEGDDGKSQNEGQWCVAERKGSKRCKTIPVQVEKKSNRVLDTGLSITEKAVKLVAARNLETSGIPSKNSYNFAILNSVSPEYLEKVASDSGVAFNPSLGSPTHRISILQAHELVQAKLAEAAFKLQKELEARKPKENNGRDHRVSKRESSKAVQFEARVTRSKTKTCFLDEGSIRQEGVKGSDQEAKMRRKNSSNK